MIAVSVIREAHWRFEDVSRYLHIVPTLEGNAHNTPRKEKDVPLNYHCPILLCKHNIDVAMHLR